MKQIRDTCLGSHCPLFHLHLPVLPCGTPAQKEQQNCVRTLLEGLKGNLSVWAVPASCKCREDPWAGGIHSLVWPHRRRLKLTQTGRQSSFRSHSALKTYQFLVKASDGESVFEVEWDGECCPGRQGTDVFKVSLSVTLCHCWFWSALEGKMQWSSTACRGSLLCWSLSSGQPMAYTGAGIGASWQEFVAGKWTKALLQLVGWRSVQTQTLGDVFQVWSCIFLVAAQVVHVLVEACSCLWWGWRIPIPRNLSWNVTNKPGFNKLQQYILDWDVLLGIILFSFFEWFILFLTCLWRREKKPQKVHQFHLKNLDERHF